MIYLFIAFFFGEVTLLFDINKVRNEQRGEVMLSLIPRAGRYLVYVANYKLVREAKQGVVR